MMPTARRQPPPLCFGRRPRAGQALMLAVLIMTAILLIGAIFVAVVAYNQGATARHGGQMEAGALAESGIAFVSRALSTHDADWRPPEPPWVLDSDLPQLWTAPPPNPRLVTLHKYYTDIELERGLFAIRQDIGGLPGMFLRRGFTKYPDPLRPIDPTYGLPPDIGLGHFLVRVTYDPDPPYEPDDAGTPDPYSWMVRIDSVGIVESGEGQNTRRLTAFKPGLDGFVRWVTDKNNTGMPINLGIPTAQDIDGDGTANGLDLNNDGTIEVPEQHAEYISGPVQLSGQLELFSSLLVDGISPGLYFQLQTTPTAPTATGPSYLRDDTLAIVGGVVYPPGYSNTAEVRVNGAPAGPLLASSDPAFNTYGGVVRDGPKGVDAAGIPRTAGVIAPPTLLSVDAETGRVHYEDLTRYSGTEVLATDSSGGSYWVNSGQWGHGRGIYVDNAEDRQFVKRGGRRDLQLLMQDWQGNIAPDDEQAGDSGWNALGTLYTPKGVEIYFAGGELPPLPDGRPAFVVALDPTAAPVAPDQYWAPAHVAGSPQIVLTRHDQTWRTATGTDSGRHTMAVDHPRVLTAAEAAAGTTIWPSTQCIMAAGNVRVSGVLPRRPPPPAGDLYSDPWPDYSLAIVSAATIYIDGSILSPQDVDPTVPDAENTKLGLLARDSVCLNTTYIAPQMAGSDTSAAGDEDSPTSWAQQWRLPPEGAARVWVSWLQGPPPVAGPPGPMAVAAICAGADPGPSALSMTVNNQPYDFRAAGLFIPASAAFPSDDRFFFGRTDWPQDVNLSQALDPRWLHPQTPVPPGPDTPNPVPGGARSPWNISTLVSPGVGARNQVAFAWANPGILPNAIEPGGGATDLLLRRWKVIENNGDSPAVHCRVNALIYAEEGCWFVIPGPWFDDLADRNGDGTVSLVERENQRRYRRYNYDILVRGMITENFTAPVSAVYDWTNKWAYPGTDLPEVAAAPGGDPVANDLPSIRYLFDSSLRQARDRFDPGTGGPWCARGTAEADLPTVPHLPVSPKLVYFGEAL